MIDPYNLSDAERATNGKNTFVTIRSHDFLRLLHSEQWSIALLVLAVLSSLFNIANAARVTVYYPAGSTLQYIRDSRMWHARNAHWYQWVWMEEYTPQGETHERSK